MLIIKSYHSNRVLESIETIESIFNDFPLMFFLCVNSHVFPNPVGIRNICQY